MKSWDAQSIREDLAKKAPRWIYDNMPYLYEDYLPFPREEVADILDELCHENGWNDLFQDWANEEFENTTMVNTEAYDDVPMTLGYRRSDGDW